MIGNAPSFCIKVDDLEKMYNCAHCMRSKPISNAFLKLYYNIIAVFIVTDTVLKPFIAPVVGK